MEQNTAQTSLERLAQLMEEHKDNDLTEIPVPQGLMKQILEEFRETMGHLKTIHRQFMRCEKMAALGNLMAGIAHEISTPVASINSNTDLFTRSLNKIRIILSSDNMPVELREVQQMMQMVNILDGLNQSNKTACDRVMNIVKGFRSFARSDTAELRDIDIREELENALTLVHHELKRRINVVRKYGDIPQCSCFPSRLNGVFVNMLVNASQAIKGEGEITIETLTVGDTIKIRFTDTGEGIPPENLERLFEPGFTTKSPGEGTGLGLAICADIMKEHNGSIEVESQVGKGTTFTVTLPIKHGASADESQDA